MDYRRYGDLGIPIQVFVCGVYIVCSGLHFNLTGTCYDAVDCITKKYNIPRGILVFCLVDLIDRIIHFHCRIK